MEIKKELCGLNNSESELYRKPVLQNEIENLSTFSVYIPANISFIFHFLQNEIRIFLFTNGKGKIIQKNQEFSVNEIAVFMPVQSADFVVETKDENLTVLEIVLKLISDELAVMKNQQPPYFINYSGCKKYKEAIKSPKTINRMLIPENIVPRFCMGSVETTGPDKVEAHSHPMLEQLFFGLGKNDCIVIADENETTFKENVLLHIPLGSEHGVKVENGKIMNYIWMDFFRNKNDMSYMAENHFIQED
jgi:hypothetical protein